MIGIEMWPYRAALLAAMNPTLRQGRRLDTSMDS